jgi:soluble lytic murein transglycosylase-like protein
VDALPPIAPAGPAPYDSLRAGAPQAEAASFAAILERQLAGARSEINSVRAEIASLREGGARNLARNSGRTAAATRPMSIADVAARLKSSSTGDVADPYGWRRMARSTGEQVIGTGYGPLFERQIEQESGFSPDVVFGLRKSSAGAEGIAQLMPQYYPNVDRSDPQASLVAGAKSMEHYLSAWDGDVRKALASYNAGLGKVRQLVAAHGERWEGALPLETRQYLSAIVGDMRPTFTKPSSTVAVFGGRGPGGVLTMPVDRSGSRAAAGGLELFAAEGSDVRAPADGTVRAAEGGTTLTIDHGNGWESTLRGIDGARVAAGATVRRGEVLGSVDARAKIEFSLTLRGQTQDPLRYLLG